MTSSHAQDVQDASSLQIIGDEALLGTLDLYAIRAMPGEVLIGAPPILHGLKVVMLGPESNNHSQSPDQP